MSDHTLTVTDDSFDELVLNSTRPILVDFWAPWCVPCKKLSPILDEIAAECSDKIAIAKLDIDANPNSAKNYRVMSLPTMVVFRDGEVVGRITGAKDKATLLKDIGATLSVSEDTANSM
ncbi:MAG: thioredoxin [Rhodococcus sp. (in: high G+C Gram-positive bacteria)]|nr:MAG: thioredoxin [Rhodococcus sp. (in: high G+C Gram-positive bacteria)]